MWWEVVTAMLVGAATGFWLGRQRNRPPPPPPPSPSARQQQQRDDDDAAKTTTTTMEEVIPYEDVQGGDLKMVLVVRNDLQMGKGKVAAQCAHAILALYKKAIRSQPHLVRAWEESGYAKITLKVSNEEELLAIMAAAKRAGLAYALIQDAGRTQIAAGSRTVLAIGPNTVAEIDKVTGQLKLY